MTLCFLQAKTAQVKQYKKQTDQFRDQVEAGKDQAEILKAQVSLLVLVVVVALYNYSGSFSWVKKVKFHYVHCIACVPINQA